MTTQTLSSLISRSVISWYVTYVMDVTGTEVSTTAVVVYANQPIW